MYNLKIKTIFLARAFGTSGLKKLVLILQMYILYTRKAVYNKMREITIIVFGNVHQFIVHSLIPYDCLVCLCDCAKLRFKSNQKSDTQTGRPKIKPK